MGKESEGPSGSCSSAGGSRSQNNMDSLTKDKLRVLCLHGYRQNGDMLKSKLGSLRKFVGKYAELVFITAPHKAAPLEPGAEVPEEQRSWWFNKDDKTFKGTNKNGPAYGFEESLRLVEHAWKEQGPFQGLLGFSQGACFAGLICGLAEKHLTSIKPNFAIIAAGFMSGSLVHKGIYEEMISLPTLHVFGSGDDIIPMDMSQTLMARFRNAVALEHTGGHYFAATAATKQIYIDFFQDRLVEYLEQQELQSSGNVIFIDEEEQASESNSSADSSS